MISMDQENVVALVDLIFEDILYIKVFVVNPIFFTPKLGKAGSFSRGAEVE